MKYLIPFIGLAFCAPAFAQDKSADIKVDAAKVEAVYKDMFKGAKGEWAKRIVQDETQKLCSQYRNQLSDADFQESYGEGKSEREIAQGRQGHGRLA